MSDGRDFILKALRAAEADGSFKFDRSVTPSVQVDAPNIISAEEFALIEESSKKGTAIRIGPIVEFSVVDGKLVIRKLDEPLAE